MTDIKKNQYKDEIDELLAGGVPCEGCTHLPFDPEQPERMATTRIGDKLFCDVCAAILGMTCIPHCHPNLETMATRIIKLEEENKDLKKKVKRLQNNNMYLSNEIEKLKESIEDLEEEIERLREPAYHWFALKAKSPEEYQRLKNGENNNE